MYKFSTFFLLMFMSVSVFAQPKPILPINSSTIVTTSRQPTFKWTQVAGATQYEFYITINIPTDTTFANDQLIPVDSTVNKSHQFVTVGTQSTDTTYTLADTVLYSPGLYFWKVRAYVGSTWTAWSYPYSQFKIGSPPHSMSNSNADITFNQDTLGAITGVTFANGSGQQLLDNTYNSAFSYGLGGNGPQPDTIVSWTTSTNGDTDVFTYRSTPKYGSTGSKVMTVYSGTNGVTADIAMTLENSKTIHVATVWSPGGAAGGSSNDVLLVNNSTVSKTSVTYPPSPASFGPDSITLSAMYNTNYNEYFGIKSSSPIAVADTQSTGVLKQVLSFANSSGSNKTFNYSFAVRNSRAAYFNTWANNTPIIVTKPATGDTLNGTSQYVDWESFGATPSSISYSGDGGATFSHTQTISNDTSAIDSALYTMPSEPPNSNSVVEVTSPKGTGKSGVFTLITPYMSITSPDTGAIVTPGNHYVVWHNATGSGITGVQVSLDSGKTWIGTQAISPADTATVDSVLYDFTANKTSSANSFVRIFSNASDTSESGRFTISSGGAIFSIPRAYGSPNQIIAVTLRAQDNVVSDSITSFDIKMNFDSTYVTFDSLVFAPLLQSGKWVTAVVDTNTLTTDSNYVRIAAFKGSSGSGIKDSAIATLYFTAKNKQSIIGQSDTLNLKNSVLAASGNNAASLNVSNSTNGVITINSSVSGSLHYLHEDTVAASYTISGDSLMVYKDITDSTNDAYFSVTAGQYDMTNRPPNDSVVIYPTASEYTNAGWNSINIVDARLAFLDFQDPLSTRGKIAADVNGDSVVNSTDAEMIMDIAVDSTYLKGLGLSNWVFVDSTTLDSVEHSPDSLSAWWTAEKHSLSFTLTNQLVNQDFFGVLRGDVNFSYADSLGQNVTTAKSMAKSVLKSPGIKTVSTSYVLFSTSTDLGAQPGDTVWIPLNVYPDGSSIGGFDASMQVNPNLFTYTGKFKLGSSMPKTSNWYVASHCDASGQLRVAATDFSVHIVPIKSDGAVILFGFVVNSKAKTGTTSPVAIQTQTVVDPGMHSLPTQTKNGEIQISNNGVAIPQKYGLDQNYPNPFNPSTTIRFELPTDSRVNITIYNVLGQKVATLVNGVKPAGYHDVSWNASRFSSGVYFSVIRASSLSNGKHFRSARKLMLLK